MSSRIAKKYTNALNIDLTDEEESSPLSNNRLKSIMPLTSRPYRPNDLLRTGSLTEKIKDGGEESKDFSSWANKEGENNNGSR